MRIGIILFSALFCISAFSGVPTIECTSAGRSVVFDEGIDDFYLDIKDTASEESLMAGITGKVNHHAYLLHITIPKLRGEGEVFEGAPNCLFRAAHPLLYNCTHVAPTQLIKLTDLNTGESTTLDASVLVTSSVKVERRSLNTSEDTDDLNKDETIVFSLQMAFSSTAPKSHSFVRRSVEFGSSMCKSGRGTQSPAH